MVPAMMRYTAIFGDKDVLMPTRFRGVVFTDRLDSTPRWEYRIDNSSQYSPRLSARYYKMMPHRLFPSEEYSIWTDGHIELLRDPQELADEFLDEADIALFKHRQRECIYDEALVCRWHKLDDPQRIDALVEECKRDGYPRGSGLVESGVIIRRHTDAINELDERWWDAILNKCCRDQLSFNFLCWKMGIEYNTIPGTISKENGIVRCHGHR
jgi:hypothetical protein